MQKKFDRERDDSALSSFALNIEAAADNIAASAARVVRDGAAAALHLRPDADKPESERRHFNDLQAFRRYQESLESLKATTEAAILASRRVEGVLALRNTAAFLDPDQEAVAPAPRAPSINEKYSLVAEFPHPSCPWCLAKDRAKREVKARGDFGLALPRDHITEYSPSDLEQVKSGRIDALLGWHECSHCNAAWDYCGMVVRGRDGQFVESLLAPAP